MNAISSVIEPERTLTANYRFRYRHTPPMFNIRGTPKEKQRAITVIGKRYAPAIKAMQALASRNRENPEPHRSLQEYYCIGCDVGDGELRAQVFGLAAYPLVQVAMQQVLAEQLTLQCYFPQTYEPIAGQGPGGIIGTMGWGTPDTSASRCYKYWRWVSDDQPQSPYLNEDDAEVELWKLSFIAFPRGKHWLDNLPAILPGSRGWEFPPELKHDLMALLGIPAMQRLVRQRLKRDIVLLDDRHVIERKHLHWWLAV